MQKYSSSSFLWPIHPKQPHAQRQQQGRSWLPQTSFLIQDKILNALKMESGQHLGAEEHIPKFLCSLSHTQDLWVSKWCHSNCAAHTQLCSEPAAHFSPSPVLIWDSPIWESQHTLTQSTSQTARHAQGGFPAANVTLPFKFMHCIANKSLSQYLKHSAGLNFPTRLKEPRHILSFPLPADSCNPETAEGGCTFSPSWSYATSPRPGMKASLCPKTKALSFYWEDDWALIPSACIRRHNFFLLSTKFLDSDAGPSEWPGSSE